MLKVPSRNKPSNPVTKAVILVGHSKTYIDIGEADIPQGRWTISGHPISTFESGHPKGMLGLGLTVSIMY